MPRLRPKIMTKAGCILYNLLKPCGTLKKHQYIYLQIVCRRRKKDNYKDDLFLTTIERRQI